jgi:hypothetical protein
MDNLTLLVRQWDRNFLLNVSVLRVFGWFKYWSTKFDLIEYNGVILAKFCKTVMKIILKLMYGTAVQKWLI